jgi:DNA (cytosine-5)-methyltransferase 1
VSGTWSGPSASTGCSVSDRPFVKRECQRYPFRAGVSQRKKTVGKVSSSLFGSLLRGFERAGYQCSWSLLNAADYGTAQSRRRVFIVGNHMGLSFQFPRPTHSSSGKKKWKTLGDVVDGLDGPARLCGRYSSRKAKYFSHIPVGGSWRSPPARLQKAAMGGAFYAQGGRSAFFRRLSFDRPSPILLCDPMTKACSFCHPVELRALSVAEYARVQQFPDTWKFCGSVSQRYALIANAVPIGLARAVGVGVYRALLSIQPEGSVQVEQESLRPPIPALAAR